MIRVDLSFRSVLLVAGLLLGIWLLTQVWPVLLLVAVSIVLAAALHPAVEWLHRHGVRRGLSVLIVSLLLVGLLALVGFVLVPAVITQGQSLLDRLPSLRHDAAAFLERHHLAVAAARVRSFNFGELVQPERLVATGRVVFNVLYSTVSVLALTIYFLLDARRAQRFIYYLTPQAQHHHVDQLIYQVKRTVGGYVRGQMITSGLITLYTFIVLTILGAPEALALAVLAGIGDMIPLVGGLLAVFPAVAFTLPVSFPKAFVVIVCLGLYQEFETRVLVPRVYGSTLRLPSVVVFIALLMGAEVAGIIGALLAVPIAAALWGMIEYFHEARAGAASEAAEGETPAVPATPPAEPAGDAETPEPAPTTSEERLTSVPGSRESDPP